MAVSTPNPLPAALAAADAPPPATELPSPSTPSSRSALTREGSGALSGPGSASKGGKGSLVTLAERLAQQTAPTMTGYIKKRNSENRWQRRYFVIVGQYFCYYKSADGGPMLCAMDLYRSGVPALASPGDATCCEFKICWDRERLFRAATPAEAAAWVRAIWTVQAGRPTSVAGTPTSRSSLARSTAGRDDSGGPSTNSSMTAGSSSGGGGAAVGDWGAGSSPSKGGRGGGKRTGPSKRTVGRSGGEADATTASRPPAEVEEAPASSGGACSACTVM